MESLQFLAFLIPVVGIGVIVLFVVAVIQEGKGERKAGFKQAFFTIVALVMLSIAVGSGVALLNLGLKLAVFKNAISNQQRYNSPPPLYLGTGRVETGGSGAVKPVGPTPPGTATYTCSDKCEFSNDDKKSFEGWKEQYQQWQKDNAKGLQTRRDLANTLSFLIVSLPLYIVFARLMERGARKEMEAQKKPTPLRNLYYYFVAFTGLIMLVFGAGSLINTGLKSWLKTGPSNYPEPVSIAIQDTGGVESVVKCADKCSFSSDDSALATQWLADYAAFKNRQKSTTGQYSSELAQNIPVLLFGIPLFWYHFFRIRRETAEVGTSGAPPPAVGS